MPDQIQSERVLCLGGLNTSENFLRLSEESPGSAVRLVNYETSIAGGYRRINGFAEFDLDFPEVTSVAVPAEGAVLGIFIYDNTIIAARATLGLPEYRFYEYQTGTGWVAYTTGITHSVINNQQVIGETFTIQGTHYIIFVDGVNNAVVFDGTDWYALNSSNTGGPLSPGGDQIIDAPSIVTFFKGSVFLSGDTSAPDIISSSAPNDPLTWTAAAGGLQQIAGFEVVQIKSFRDENYIFGETRISRSTADLEAGFVLSDVTNNIGCIARNSVVEISGNIIFLSHDGIRTVAGTTRIGDVELSSFSQNIQTTLLEAFGTWDLRRLQPLVIRQKAQFRYFFSDPDTEVADSYGIIAAFRPLNGGMLWEFGELLGIRTSCCVSGFVNGVEIFLHGDFNGNVYRQEVGSNFAGEDILAIYTTPYLDFGDTTIRKLMRKIHLFIRSEGSVAIFTSVRYDWDRQTVQNPVNYNDIANQANVQYDSGAEYDGGAQYGVGSQPVFNVNIQGSGHSVQTSFVSVGQLPSYTIQGIVYEFSVKGRA